MFTRFMQSLRKGGRSISPGVHLVVLVIFLRGLGWGFVDPYFPLYLQQFDVQYALIGVFIAFTQVGAFVALIPIMRLADRLRDTTLIQDGEIFYLFVTVFFIAAGLFKSPLLLLCALFLWGISNTFVNVGTESYIRKHNRFGRSTPFGFYVAMDHLGWIIGMLIGAFFILRTGFNWMFVWTLPAIFAAFFILPRIHDRGIQSILRGFRQYFHKPQDFTGIVSDVKSLNPKMAFFLLLAFFDGAIKMFTYAFIPLFGISIGLSIPAVAFLMAVLYFPFIFSFFLSEIEDLLPRMNVIATGLFLGALCYMLLFFIVQQTALVFLVAMTSFSIAMIRPAYNGAITRLTPRRLFGEVTGITNLAERLGRIIGPIGTGLIADAYGLSVSFLAVAVVSFLFGALSLMLHGLNPLVSRENA